MRNLRLVAVLLVLAPCASRADEFQIRSWDAPPYWTPRLQSDAPGRPEIRDAARTGRQPLAVGPTALPFIALPPCRMVDTRGNAPLTGGFLPGGSVRDYTLTGVCNIPANAKAISLNAVAVNPTGPGFLLLFPQGIPLPTVSTLNYVAGQTVANAAVVSLSASGALSAVFGVSGADLILDTNGYYAAIPAVTSVNTLSGDVVLAAGSNVSVTSSGANTLTIAAASGGPPSGTAGGSLSGTYPNPALAPGSVGGAQLANGAAVRSINGVAQDLVTLQGTGAVSVQTTGSTITVGAPSGSMVWGAAGDPALTGAGYTEVAPSRFDFWTATAKTSAPTARYHHTAVWTGSRMIVWGGVGDGGNGGPPQTTNTGGQYDPVADSWTPTSTTNAPSARAVQSAVWTGSRMIVWGGNNLGAAMNDGGQYDPGANTWTPVTTTNAPAARIQHSAVWTGSRMLVWGGLGASGPLADGALYDPVANAWSPMATAGAPAARRNHTAVWTGTRMIVWGGRDNGSTFFDDGASYDPLANSWAPVAASGLAGRSSHTAVWTGSTMIAWGGIASGGGVLNDGELYDPIGDFWYPVGTAGAPSARSDHTAVWTGARMVVWGGGGIGLSTDGAQYVPAQDIWIPVSAVGAPAPREYHSAVWTGSRMLLFGGLNVFSRNDGGQWRLVSLFEKN